MLGPNHAFLPGETVFFSCRLTGYQLGGNGATSNAASSFPGQIEVTRSHRAFRWWPKPRRNRRARGSARQELVSRSFCSHFNIPPFAPGGAYHIKVTARDEVAKTDLTSQLDFQVRGHAVEPSDTLAARNLRFVKDETDGPPLDPAVYHPGETLWARFDMTGYKYGDKNHYSVEYGLAILRESGEQVFAQPAAAADSSEGFYPQRYVPGAVSLNLQADVPEGSYTLVITMEDKVGGQTAEARGGFRIQK